MGRRLTALEERTGARLLQRLPGRYVLTALGESILGNAERIEADGQVFYAEEAELGDGFRDGVLTDSKTLTGLLWLQNTRSGAWPLDWQPAPAQD